jgi:hypothetical protein
MIKTRKYKGPEGALVSSPGITIIAGYFLTNAGGVVLSYDFDGAATVVEDAVIPGRYMVSLGTALKRDTYSFILGGCGNASGAGTLHFENHATVGGVQTVEFQHKVAGVDAALNAGVATVIIVAKPLNRSTVV